MQLPALLGITFCHSLLLQHLKLKYYERLQTQFQTDQNQELPQKRSDMLLLPLLNCNFPAVEPVCTTGMKSALIAVSQSLCSP